MKGSTSKNEDVWCTDCKEGHTKGTCPKKAFCEICQMLGHAVKECPYNMKTKGNQVFFAQEQPPLSTAVGSAKPQADATASSGGYIGNRRGGRGNNNNNNRSRMQYDANGRPIIQCRTCNQWGHFARECQNSETPQSLCRWCGPGDHNDANCPKQGVNLLNIEKMGEHEEVLAITHAQAKKTYPDPRTEMERLREAKADIEREISMSAEGRKDTKMRSPSTRVKAEKNIIGQVLQMEIEEPADPEVFPPEYREYKEGEARVDEAPAHQFEKDKPIQFEESKLKATNLGKEEDPRNILVGDD
ncbi:uncharacterized protein LOC131063560 [Cryptomeria japonica]|uniref:uncharacterized protein LOC131063560 n=1 Tax=Cryptomeria japonica TaxID=3369 RepID=UPI0025AD1D03|nr:uncharacterized protein LOC131063560 [Cryptomeria japonica]